MIGSQERSYASLRGAGIGYVVLRLDRPVFALMAALGLGGCFGSRETYIGAADSVKLFGEQGQAERIHIGGVNGRNESVSFSWTANSYKFTDQSGKGDPALYRVSPLSGNWLITQRLEHGVAVYGLARREPGRLWTYSPQCKDLTESERAAAGLAITASGTCWIASAAQLRKAMQLVLPHNPKPDGYFEMAGAR